MGAGVVGGAGVACRWMDVSVLLRKFQPFFFGGASLGAGDGGGFGVATFRFPILDSELPSLDIITGVCALFPNSKLFFSLLLSSLPVLIIGSPAPARL